MSQQFHELGRRIRNEARQALHPFNIVERNLSLVDDARAHVSVAFGCNSGEFSRSLRQTAARHRPDVRRNGLELVRPESDVGDRRDPCAPGPVSQQAQPFVTARGEYRRQPGAIADDQQWRQRTAAQHAVEPDGSAERLLRQTPGIAVEIPPVQDDALPSQIDEKRVDLLPPQRHAL